jgi:hypothetical protein
MIMEYEMKKLSAEKLVNNIDVCKQTAEYILTLLKGCTAPKTINGTTYITEKFRQFCTWGAKSFMLIYSTYDCYGLQFAVSGLKHRGRVRIYYNPASDYFDVELLRARKNELVWGCEDLDFEQLHNVLHQHIERTDDKEV